MATIAKPAPPLAAERTGFALFAALPRALDRKSVV